MDRRTQETDIVSNAPSIIASLWGIGWFRGIGKGRKDKLGCDPALRGDLRTHHRENLCSWVHSVDGGG